MTIRPLSTQDAHAYQTLRLQALQTNPDSYLSTYESEKDKPTDAFAWEIRYAASPQLGGYYGLFTDAEPQELIGYAQLDPSQLPKQQHTAALFNLYVHPDHRHQGHAKKLISHITDLAKQHGIEQIFINCNRKNQPAQKLYQSLGFTEYGVKSKAVKWQGEYDDEVQMVKEL